MIVGGIPGLTATMATALLVPLTYFMPPVPAVATIRLSRKTYSVLWQNFALALGIKAVFLVLAVFGSATMWIAVSRIPPLGVGAQT